MTIFKRTTPSCDLEHFDEVNYPRPETTEFEKLADRALSRRSFLGTSLAFGASAFVMGAGALRPAEAASRIGFDQVAANSMDSITLPEGFSSQIVVSWGDPLWSKGSAFDPATRGTGESQELAFGDNNDGMSVFADGNRNIMVVNNEYVNREIIHGNRPDGLPENPDDVRKSKAGHGVSITEIAEKNGKKERRMIKVINNKEK